MNKIKYILGMSDIKPPDGAGAALASSHASAAARVKKRGKIRRAVVAAAAVTVASAAVFAVAAAVARAAKKPREEEPQPEKHLDIVDTLFSLDAFSYTASYTRIGNDCEVVIDEDRISGYKEFFGVCDDRIAGTVWHGGTRFVTADDAAGSGRADLAEAAQSVKGLPDGLKTIPIGKYTDGSFDYLLAFTAVYDSATGNIYAPDSPGSAPAGSIGKLRSWSPNDLLTVIVDTDAGFDPLARAVIYKIRIESSVPVIYGVFDDVTVKVEHRTDTVQTFLCSFGGADDVRFFAHGYIGLFEDYYLTEDQPRYFKTETEPEGFDEHLIFEATEQLGLQWFLPMFRFGEKGAETYVGEAIYAYGEKDESGAHTGTAYRLLSSDDRINLLYSANISDSPFFDESFCRAKSFTALTFDGRGKLSGFSVLKPETLADMLKNSGRIPVQPGKDVLTCPAFDCISYPCDDAFYPVVYSSDYLPFASGGCAPGDRTLLDRLGLKIPETGKTAVYTDHGDGKTIELRTRFTLTGLPLTVTGIGEPYAEGDLTAVSVRCYEAAGDYVADLTGTLTGYITEDGIYYFDGISPHETLSVVYDGERNALCCRDAEAGAAGVAPDGTAARAVICSALGISSTGKYGFISGVEDLGGGTVRLTGFFPEFDTDLTYLPYKCGGGKWERLEPEAGVKYVLRHGDISRHAVYDAVPQLMVIELKFIENNVYIPDEEKRGMTGAE